jgi:hypothetical protein
MKARGTKINSTYCHGIYVFIIFPFAHFPFSCSNIAVKVNAKLSNHRNRAVAWKTSSGLQSTGGITWVDEVPTMVRYFV